MKLLFDNQIFYSQNFGGISRYFCNLFTEFKNINPDISISLPILHHQNQHLKEVESLIEKSESTKNFRLFRNYQKENNNLLTKTINEQNYDILHATYYDVNLMKLKKDKPLVITIHDMIHEIYPEFFSLKDNVANYKKEMAMKADKIITVSENTKNDLLKFIKLDEKKIEVIPLASSFKNVVKKTNKSKYILYVGNRTIYKNFYFMVSSIVDILKENVDLNLLCFGQDFSKKEIKFLENLGVQDKVKVIGKNDQDLINLYSNALAFIMPSYYEGFGIPILEAMSCGCPVIASNQSSIPEVAADSAFYFDAKDAKSIKYAVDKVISDEELRKNLAAKGYERNELFSWNKTANKTLQIYNSLL